MDTNTTPPEQESPRRPWAIGVAVLGGILAALLRVVPHPPNFTAVGGLGIFGGARLRGWQAYLLPLAIMFLSDLVLWVVTGFDPLYSMGHLSRFYVYAGFMIYVAIGRSIADTTSLLSVTMAATLGGVAFFFVTNFCEWLFQPFQIGYETIAAPWRYSRDFEGLVTCFGWALGFYRQENPVPYPFMAVTSFPCAMLVWTVLGDVLFTTAYVLVHNKLVRRPAAAEAEAEALPTPAA